MFKLPSVVVTLVFWVLCIPPSAAQSLQSSFRHRRLGDATSIVIKADGGIIVAGYESYGQQAQRFGNLAFLHPSGAEDSRFTSGLSPEGYSRNVTGLHLLEDESLLVCGDFGSWSDEYVPTLLRLTPEGALDRRFLPEPDHQVQDIAPGQHGSIWAAHRFGLVRFDPSGTVLDSWSTAPNDHPYERKRLLALPGGGVLLGGRFQTFANQPRAGLARMTPDGSLDTSFTTGTNGVVLALARQNDGKLLVGGDFTQIGGLAQPWLARLNTDGTVDADFAPALDASVYSIAVQPDGRIVIGGSFIQVGGQERRYLARLLPDGSMDTDFQPEAREYVRALAVQPDGRIIAGGAYSFDDGRGTFVGRFYPDGQIEQDLPLAFGGPVTAMALPADGRLYYAEAAQPGSAPATPTARLQRLHIGGRWDLEFEVTANGKIECLGVQADGMLVAGGQFTTFSGAPRLRLARLNAEGVLEGSFHPALNGRVAALALCADGGWLVGGDFTTVNGQTRERLTRLLPDGNVDAAFHASANAAVEALSLLPDGRCYAAGAFSQAGGLPRTHLARLALDGTVDAAFAPLFDAPVKAVCALDDGGCFAGGEFTLVNGIPRGGLARLDAEGSVDAHFAPALSMRVHAVQMRADGVVQVAGDEWNPAQNEWIPRLRLLHPDGTLLLEMMEADVESVSSRDTVAALIPEADGKLFAGGDFSYSDGREGIHSWDSHRLARCSAPPGTHQRLGLSRSGRVLTWTRLGGLARLERVTFDAAGADGAWFPLGTAQRIGSSADWAVSALALTPGMWKFRARGMVAGGSGSWHELTSHLEVRAASDFGDWLEARHGPRAGDVKISAPGAPSPVSSVPNLLAYASGQSAGEDAALPAHLLPSAAMENGGHPQVRLPLWPARADIVLTVQASSHLPGPWTALARSTSGGPFNALISGVSLEETLLHGVPHLVITEPPTTSAAQERRFYRVVVDLAVP